MNKFFPILLMMVTLALSPAQTPTLQPTVPPTSATTPGKPKGVHNDQIYPPSAEAAKSISFDGAGFLINGQRKYLSSGTIHFTRVPNELWRDRLTRMKNADFVNVESYVFWNYSEPRENEWHFTGDGDFEKFLNTAQELGLTALIRIGPYVCAEWESGGWPLWLRFKPTMNLRTCDPEFLKWNDHWYDKILPMVAKHQISKGGNVALLQIENEHPMGWGIVNDDPYFDHLKEQVKKHGIEIPWFFSGLNHGGNPAPADMDPSQRKNPWMSTEFWAGWFDTYGLTTEKKLHAIEKANWEILAHGGGGHNFYMLHGGSNFDSWSDNSTASSYDFGAAIGQAGDLRPSYYKMKRANLLAQSFPDIIANSTSALADYKNTVTGGKIEVLGARRSPAGTLLFLRNNSHEDSRVTFQDGCTLKMARYSTVAMPRDVVLEKDVKIATSTLPILGVARNEGVTTVVFYGLPGEKGSVTLSVPEMKLLNFTVSENSIAESLVDLPSGAIRILVIPQDLSLRTWRLGASDKQIFVFGPAYVRDVVMHDGAPVVTYERFQNQPSCGQVAVYGASEKKPIEWHFAATANDALEKEIAPTLSAWQSLSSAAPAEITFDDSKWFASEQPQQMGADGDNSSFAWYRAILSVPSAGHGTLHIKGGDMLTVFLNGKPVLGKGTSYPVDLSAGKNSVAVFVTHAGRNKGFLFCKPVATLDPKGILGEVTLELNNQKIPVTGWRMKGGPGIEEAVWTRPDSVKGWNPFATASGVPTFYHATFENPALPEYGVHPILRLKWTGLTRGMVWVNGHSLGRYPERIRVDSLYIPEPWLRIGMNDVVIFDTEGASPAQVTLVVDKASREVLRTGATVDPKIPFVVPQENLPRDLAAMNAGNVAFKASATASGSVKDASPENATDGDIETLWKAATKLEPGQPHPWLAVDLGKPVPLGIVEVVWEGSSRTYKYMLEGSADGATWKKIGDQSTAVPTSPDTISELSRLNFHGEPYQHLRVTIEEGKSPSIAELRVFAAGK